jgi:phosphoglycolate phosphatase
VENLYLELLEGELESANFDIKPGVKELLPLLAAREDILLGLETGNLEVSSWMKLRHGGLDSYFRFGGFGSDSESRTELIRMGIARGEKLNGGKFDPGRVFVIGDAPADVKCGREAGAVTIAVGTGILDQAEVRAAGPDFYLKDLSDIPAFFKCIGCRN